jgi:hypothetical protein
MTGRSVLELRDPEQERQERAAREREERARLVHDGALGERQARVFVGNVSRSTLYGYTREFQLRTIKIKGRRSWPVVELRRVLDAGLEDVE